MPVKQKLAKRLVEPDYWTCPHGDRGRPVSFLTYGPEVADLCAAADFAPDPQQELGLDLIFAVRPDGSPASFSFCVICCRQNLKTGLFKQAALGFIYVQAAPGVVWSAHEMSTTNEAQRDLEQLITDHAFLSKELAGGQSNGIYYGNSDQRIEFRTGQQIMFKARTNTGGRGLAKERLILDEAFALTASMMGAILPVMTAQPNAQVLYGSSAGKADSDVLLDIRERGRNHMTERMSYLEWLAPREDCADRKCKHPKDAVRQGVDCALDREHLLLKANPSVVNTDRISLERLRDLRQELPPEEFMRECLGWWDEAPGAGERPISTPAWAKLEVPSTEVPIGEPDRFALSMSGERILSIGVVVDGETPYVDLAECSRVDDPDSVIDWLAKRCGRKTTVMIDTRDPAAQFVPALRARKVKVNVCTQTDAARASMAFKAAIDNGLLSHCGQPEIEDAIKVAVKRDIGRARQWEFDPATTAADITPLRAVVLAHYGLSFEKPKKNGSGRRAVSL